MSEYRSLIHRVFTLKSGSAPGEYSRQRQQARHRSLPTLLRWIWETASAPGVQNGAAVQSRYAGYRAETLHR